MPIPDCLWPFPFPGSPIPAMKALRRDQNTFGIVPCFSGGGVTPDHITALQASWGSSIFLELCGVTEALA